ANATVKVIDQSTGQMVAQTVTDQDGEYIFDGVPVGNYRIQIESQGFQTYSASNFQTQSGSNTFNGQLNVGSVSERVEVNAAAASPPASIRNIQSLGRLRAGVGGGALLESMGMAGKADRF